MRVFCDPIEAVREIERDIAEMGIRYKSTTVQDKALTAENQDTTELIGYGFQISRSRNFEDHELMAPILYLIPQQPGDDLERYFFTELSSRLQPPELSTSHMRNPGRSWTYRPSMWRQYLQLNGTFHYTYAERMAPQWPKVLENLRIPGSRHAIIHFFDGISADETDAGLGHDARLTGGKGRVPCSMFYQFLVRDDLVHMVYAMRSCDFVNHFTIDMGLALAIQQRVAKDLGKKVGLFTMTIGSLHMFQSDIKKSTF